MIVTYICEYCGKEFQAQDWRHRKVCSKHCAGMRGNSGRFKKGQKRTSEEEKKRLKMLRLNPSYGMLGKKHTEETKKRMSESSKHPYNYIDGGYRNKVSNDKCSICGENKKRIIIHHKDSNRKNNDKSNLIAVCGSCHTKIHNKLSGKINKIDWNDKEQVKKYKQDYIKKIKKM